MLTLKERTFATAGGKKGWSYQIVGTCPYTGEHVRKGTRTRKRSLAEDLLRIELERRRKRALGGPDGDATFAQAVVEYLAKGGEDRYVDPMLDAWGRMRLADIKDTDVTAFASSQYPGAKASTLVRHVYGPLQWVWNAAVAAGLAQPRTFSRPKIKREPVAYAQSDDWTRKALAACTNDQQFCAVLFMTFSGARASEVVAVQCQDYNPDRGEVALRRTKGGRGRLVALPQFVNDALAKLPRPSDASPLFGYASRYSLNRILVRICKRAGIEHLSPHKAGRHTFAARLLREGASLKEVQQAGGWADIGVVARSYAHIESSVVDARIRGVASPFESGTEPRTVHRKPASPLLLTSETDS